MRHTDARERPARDDEPVSADDAEDAHAELVSARSVMAVQEDNLRYGVPKLDRFIPSPQTKYVAGVMHACDPGVCLACFDWDKARTHEPSQDSLGRNERVLRTCPFMRSRSKDGRSPLTDLLQRQRVVKRAGARRNGKIEYGIHGRIPYG